MCVCLLDTHRRGAQRRRGESAPGALVPNTYCSRGHATSAAAAGGALLQLPHDLWDADTLQRRHETSRFCGVTINLSACAILCTLPTASGLPSRLLLRVASFDHASPPRFRTNRSVRPSILLALPRLASATTRSLYHIPAFDHTLAHLLHHAASCRHYIRSRRSTTPVHASTAPVAPSDRSHCTVTFLHEMLWARHTARILLRVFLLITSAGASCGPSPRRGRRVGPGR